MLNLARWFSVLLAIVTFTELLDTALGVKERGRTGEKRMAH